MKAAVIFLMALACSGPDADPAPVFYAAQTDVIPTDDTLRELLEVADEQWESVGVRKDAVTIVDPDDSTIGNGMFAMWSSVEELSAMFLESRVGGAVYWQGDVVFIAKDLSNQLRARVAVHELGHLLAPDRDDLPCHGDPSVGMMCDGAGAARPTDADLVWICDSPTNPCNDNNPQN